MGSDEVGGERKQRNMQYFGFSEPTPRVKQFEELRSPYTRTAKNARVCSGVFSADLRGMAIAGIVLKRRHYRR